MPAMMPLDAQRIRNRLSDVTRLWLGEIEIFETIGSTNAHLLDRASREGIDGHAVLAEHQSAGRGRRGRTWKSPRGQSIALSIGVRADVPAARLGALSLVTGLAVAAALDQCDIPGVGLKWPNDIFLGGAKLGGILIEVVPLRHPCVAVIGVGINVERGDPELDVVVDPIAAVADVRAGVDRNLMASHLIDSIHAHARRFEAEGFGAFRTAWENRNIHRDDAVSILLGDSRVDGRVLGVGEGGELVLATVDGERRFTSGEVSLRPVAGGAPRLPSR